MPSVGMPRSKMAVSSFGAPSTYTDAGPPERISAIGFLRRISSTVERCETISEYTRASRTRRAISCEYWPPRSTTSTGRSSGESSGCGGTTSAATVIRRVLRDRDVVRVRLAQPGTSDAHEARILQRLDRLGAAVAHRLPEAADDLVQHAGERAFVRHTPFDALRHELLDVLDVTLEVAVLRVPARLHRAERAHAAVLLEALALRKDDVAGRFLGAREHRAEHDGVGTGRDRLRDVAGRGDPAVGNHRHAVPCSGVCDIEDRGHLRHADARDDARRTDRARADADLDRIRPCVDQCLCRFAGGDVACDDLELAAEAGDSRDHLDDRA